MPFSSKFVRLLQTFDEAELKAFDTWLRSPWCNSNKALPKLLEKLKRYHPDFEGGKLTKEKLFRQVRPKGKFSHRRMNNLLSEGYLAAERFLVFQRLAGEHNLQKDLLTRELQKRYLDQWFFKEVDREIDRLEKKSTKDWEDHLDLFHLYRRVYHHPHQEPRMQKGLAIISKMNEQIDLLFLMEKAVVINEMTFRNRFFREENHDVKSELGKWGSVAEGVQHPALDLYRMRFAGNSASMLPKYEQLWAAFKERFDELNARDQKAHLLSLLNDAKALIRSGQLDVSDSLPLYQFGLESGALFNQGKLTRNTYTSIVIASNTKGTFDFTTHFIDSFTGQVDKEIREDCLHWARAHTAYWKKDLEPCLDILQKYRFRSAHFQLISRVLLAQAYFDLFLKDPSYESYLFSFFDTFEKWLNREKIWSKATKDPFLLFVKFCRVLAQYHEDSNSDPKKVADLFEKRRDVQALNWLIQKKEEVLNLKNKPG